jgi:predicted HicB family RNase H-like nuclease
MAKIKPPAKLKSRKGSPPLLTRTVGNLNKPEPNGYGTLNLRVTTEFKRELKTLAAQQGTSMTELIVEAVGLLKKERP